MKRLMTATAITALTATSALAATAIEDIDLNGNDFVSMEEAKAVFPELSPASFEDMDVNDDNRLSAEEVNAVEAQTIFDQYEPMEVSTNRVVLDDDGDGFISIEDMRRGYPEFSDLDYEEIDANGDNRVSYEEYYSADAQTIVSRYGTTTVMDINSIDTNGDSFADFDEMVVAYPGLPQEEFEEIDLNDDNRISSEELYTIDAQNAISQYDS